MDAAQEEKDLVAEELNRMATKYKNGNNQELRFLVNDYLIPMLEMLREEYTDMFLGEEDETADELGDLAEAGMNAMVALGSVLDALTEAGTKVPPELQAQFDAARARAAEFSERAQQALESLEDQDDEEEDDEEDEE